MSDGLQGSNPCKVLATIVARNNKHDKEKGERKMMKSIISEHKATREQIEIRLNDVINCGTLTRKLDNYGVTIERYEFGSLVYIVTYVHSVLVSFELAGIYCFKF